MLVNRNQSIKAALGDGIWLEIECLDLKVVKSQYQEIKIAQTEAYGKILIVNDQIQSCEQDEFVYHEMLAHPALIFHNKPQRVLILGGGEGATAREVLKYASVQQVTMVDIDETVIQSCIKHQVYGYQSFAHPKMNLIIEDATSFIKRPGSYDVVISDLPDPIEECCAHLYTEAFFEDISRKLNKNGIFVTQCGEAGDMTNRLSLAPTFKKLSKVFTHTKPYTALIPTFHDRWSWTMASNDLAFSESLSQESIDQIIGPKSMKYFDAINWKRSTSLSSAVLRELKI